jgi:prepilin-type N-terminal cleavage/methylation domain-containing protein
MRYIYKNSAFSLIEIIFVIVIIGLLSIAINPSFSKKVSLYIDGVPQNREVSQELIQATNQVLSHIRYTRHLALIDNKFVPNPELSSFKYNSLTKEEASRHWFNMRWQITFHTVSTAPSGYRNYYYTIFSDIPRVSNTGGYTQNLEGSPHSPASIESYRNIAIDPLTKKKLTGNDWSGDILDYSENLNLVKKYGVYMDVSDLKSACNNTHWASTPRLLFDQFGRAYCDQDIEDSISDNPYIHLLKRVTKITLFKDNDVTDSLSICIEPESGYSYICP